MESTMLSFRSSDVAWMRLERWHALTPEQQDWFVPLCPDFLWSSCFLAIC